MDASWEGQFFTTAQEWHRARNCFFGGTIIGQRVECKGSSNQSTLDGDPPVFSGYSISDSDVTDRLPDCNYEAGSHKSKLLSNISGTNALSANSISVNVRGISTLYGHI